MPVDNAFFDRDIYALLDKLNEEAYAQIDMQFFDPKNGKRANQ